MLLVDRVVLVTGAARGIGAATVRAFEARGARVVATDVSTGVGIVKLDVTSREDWERVVTHHGPIDVVVNNAGIMLLGSVLELPPEVLETQVAINIQGVVNGVVACLPEMLERRTGAVVNVASVAAVIPSPGAAFYAGTKAAVLAFTRSLRLEHHGSGVLLCSVSPGVVATDLTAGIEVGWPRKRTPEEVARAIVRAVEREKAEVVVPGYLGWLLAFGALLPVPLQDTIARLFGVDELLLGADSEARSAYRARLGGADDTSGRG